MNKCISFLIIVFFLVMGINSFYGNNNENNSYDISFEIIDKKENVEFYNYVITTNKVLLYEFNNNKYEEYGFIGKNVVLNIEKTVNDYYKVKNLDGNFFIRSINLENYSHSFVYDNRYKKYIVFNQNVITYGKTDFFDSDDNLVYSINKSYSLPIVVKEDNKYGVDFGNNLLYIKASNVSVVDNYNTDSLNSDGIPVLNYHFVYENDDTSCDSEICHSVNQIDKHFSYIKNNDFFTPTMKELEMYIDSKLQLPQKSVVITFDDGTRADMAKKMVDKYELNATLFLITSRFDDVDIFRSSFFEVHSHSDNLHNVGVCPTGQGGGIQCLDRDTILNDLKKSRDKIGNTTVFCYPFYEYNDYSIGLLKEAGFTMAFAGEHAGGKTKVTVGCNKFKLPRWVIVNYTTMDQFIRYVNGYE